MPTTQANYRNKPVQRDKPRISKTIPGQVTTIKAIYDRFRRGQGVEVFDAGYAPDLPEGFENLDKLERIDALREVKQNIARQRATLQFQQEEQRRQQAASSGSPKPEEVPTPPANGGAAE